ncbi:hypothetical protein PXW73_16925, partial [Klebsiella pneumoniae]|uniref:hypothetical protein n=1 Tax=Klebsiella pneumoniae TaxID=573 RepID=UPI0023811C4D
SKRKGNLLLFGHFIVVAMNPWFDSESGHHYLKNPPKRRVFAFGKAMVCFPLLPRPQKLDLLWREPQLFGEQPFHLLVSILSACLPMRTIPALIC